MADGLYQYTEPSPTCRSFNMVLQLPEGWKMNGLGLSQMIPPGYPAPALRSYPPPTATVTSSMHTPPPPSRPCMEHEAYTTLRDRVAHAAYFAYNDADAGALHHNHSHHDSGSTSRHRREVENASPRSVASSSSGYGSYHSPSPGARSVDSPSPTTETANKLYNLLKNPENSYNLDEVWSTEAPLDLKRKAPSDDSPMDLSVRTKRVKVDYNIDYIPQYFSQQPVDQCQMSQHNHYRTQPQKLIRHSPPPPTTPRPRTPPSGHILPHNHTENKEATKDNDSGSLLQSLLGGHSETVHDHSRKAWDSFERSFAPKLEETVKPASSRTIVCLAKKNLFPVSARVSDWIVKMVTFAQSLAEFNELTNDDQVTLILNSWTRLLLLYMAETAFEFVVTPVGDAAQVSAHLQGKHRLEETPTVRSVELIKSFISKCQALGLDTQEYQCLKKIVLFNTGCGPLEDPSFVDVTSSRVQQELQEHVKLTRPSEKMRYSQILLCMPSMYNINGRVMDHLFCKHLTTESDMEVLLKEMIHKR